MHRLSYVAIWLSALLGGICLVAFLTIFGDELFRIYVDLLIICFGNGYFWICLILAIIFLPRINAGEAWRRYKVEQQIYRNPELMRCSQLHEDDLSLLN
jgi:hypothetical protein